MSGFHLRMFWGAFDVSYPTPEYTGADIVSGGTSAEAGSGVGVRRASIAFTRTPPGSFDDDVAAMHIDLLNLTGGHPDDTWTTGDYTNADNAIGIVMQSLMPVIHTSHAMHEVRYYRVGTGVFPPNPPDHISPMNKTGTSSSQMLPPQVACSVTFKTARRKQWGRTYVPGITTSSLTGNGIYSTTFINLVAQAFDDGWNDAASNDLHFGVLSKIAGSFFTTEQLQVDNVADVIRRRRWRNATARKTFP